MAWFHRQVRSWNNTAFVTTKKTLRTQMGFYHLYYFPTHESNLKGNHVLMR